ncbi:hypothetical protein DFJ58DRAFT_815527 [Suillus subalutaceus]|uniref:uncharacterized protein n=1 Tax=Suillus subalutaceus TaxID=48586 RepID=UPI001B875F00|nr:uncharacterized protein DFJ58DRAFT_815527 [Suillus subalutaceus]KAG1837580.1 hypothetical protein DFJ58DRAFT_815527 [Suillus subalutaceus]
MSSFDFFLFRLTLLVFFFQSSLAVALLKADLVLVLSCSPPLHTVTSLLSPPPISSSPIPSLLTRLFRFPIVKGRPQTHSFAWNRYFPIFRFLDLINIGLCVSLGQFFFTDGGNSSSNEW